MNKRVLVVVMDGVGEREEHYGNAVHLAWTPAMNWLKTHGLYTTLRAHGTAVGLPSDSDIGNSEVGHNALGAGRTFDQGAKLVNNAITSGRMFAGDTWREIVGQVRANDSTLHFLGLLSDGNVHSHEDHLYQMLAQAKQDGVRKVRIHVLFDGRDVGEKSAEIYVEHLEKVLTQLRSDSFDVQPASAGGRMRITMDRYEADWGMVERGWHLHVLGEGPRFPSLSAALQEFRKDSSLTDQYLPEFVIPDADGHPVGPIHDGDGVILFNFRGDRAMEISRAFCESDLPRIGRVRMPDVYFAGMMEYDGDLKIPNKYLVSPPQIDNTLSEYLIERKLRQYACSETQKFGHVTYFWNGNRTGYIDEAFEEYVQIPSDEGISFDQRPWMKASEITDATIQRMLSGSFDFGRINYANGDMVGHTGDLEASVIAVQTVDWMLRKLIHAAQQSNTILLITADHGNCDEMFDGKQDGWEQWESLSAKLSPKTAHTLSPVPLYLYDPAGHSRYQLRQEGTLTLANIANTALNLLGLESRELYQPSLITMV
ncbi:2,3-bisphosphoglycerate-independent phosphoglycerate mutase [Candidatus Entotheonella palauensis]|uniref:2,3-bisphosphoglycerate-independent phosphoglycerate mutase n=1 Tax=Candidatus Entotheonella palauensis TaxID=93172 RepID=UPI000B7ED198|nr:2,3-bisphosphoglycerate-independent phosphoglycerate mutase [Candidatus Entotheonella palauensis]